MASIMVPPTVSVRRNLSKIKSPRSGQHRKSALIRDVVSPAVPPQSVSEDSFLSCDDHTEEDSTGRKIFPVKFTDEACAEPATFSPKFGSGHSVQSGEVPEEETKQLSRPWPGLSLTRTWKPPCEPEEDLSVHTMPHKPGGRFSFMPTNCGTDDGAEKPAATDSDDIEEPRSQTRCRIARRVVASSGEEEDDVVMKKRVDQSSRSAPVSPTPSLTRKADSSLSSRHGKDGAMTDAFVGKLHKKALTRRNRALLATEWYNCFNAKVFEGRLPKDLEITWNARARKTAGFTRFLRWDGLSVTSHAAEDEDDERAAPTPTGGIGRPVVTVKCIDLSTKVVSDEFRLVKTLLHECCHVAQRLLGRLGVAEGRKVFDDPPHGPVFQWWAARASAVVGHPSLAVSRCHDYSLDPPFKWVCDQCGHLYQRWSQSIHPGKHGCGVNNCKGHLTFLGSEKGDRDKALSEYQRFVKENYEAAKSAWCQRVGSDRCDHRAVLKELAAEWRKKGSGLAS